MKALLPEPFRRFLRIVFRNAGRGNTLAICGVITFIVSLAGPFGTFRDQPYWQGLHYWGCIVFASVFFAYGVREIVLLLNLRQGSLKFEVLTCLLFGCLFGPMIFGFSVLYFPQSDDLPSLAFFIVSSSGVFVTITVFRHLLGLEQLQAPAPRLMERLPENKADKIGRLEASGHYVDVYFQHGAPSVRLRMRLQDAVAEMDWVPGHWVHRSHWVTRHVMQGMARENGRDLMYLRCGAKLPVGRTYRDDLIKADVV